MSLQSWWEAGRTASARAVPGEYSLGLRAFSTPLLRWGLGALQPGTGLSGVALTSEGRKAPSEGQGHSASPMVSSGARSKGVYRRGTWRVGFSRFRNRGGVKFTPQPTHPYPRQDGLCVAPRPRYRPSHSLSLLTGSGGSGDGREGEAHSPQTQGTAVFTGPVREGKMVKRSPARGWRMGRWDFRAPLRAAPAPPTWPPRSRAARCFMPLPPALRPNSALDTRREELRASRDTG